MNGLIVLIINPYKGISNKNKIASFFQSDLKINKIKNGDNKKKKI